MNAIRHGVASRHTLMPGEDPHAYSTLLAGYFESFGPRNVAEAAVVSELADLGFRLRRLTMTTDGIMLRRLDQHVEQTRLYRVRHKTGNCLIVVRATAAVVEEVAPKDTVAEMALFLDGLDQLIAMLDDLEDLAPVHVAALEAARDRWTSDGNGSSLRATGYRALAPVLRKVEEALCAKRVSEDEQLEELKKQIAQSDLLLNGDDLKLLDRHRRSLEQATAKQLELLATVRASTVETSAEGVEVKLRVVK